MLLVRNYLTRRIRRHVHGPDIESVLGKQITIPLIVPWDLENYILNQLPQDFPDLPTHVTSSKPLIHVHDVSKYDPTTGVLPSLQDVASEKGNLRYWVITNTSMWAGQHHAVDETAEILWSLFHWFNQAVKSFAPDDPEMIGTDHELCKWHVAESCRRRIVLPQIPSDDGFEHQIPSVPRKSVKAAMPTLRESLLFRPWVFHTPVKLSFGPVGDEYIRIAHELFHEDGVLYPFPDELFWNEGDEGEWDENEAPPWRDVEETAEDRNKILRYEFGAFPKTLVIPDMAIDA
jgi:hypothetical protein